MSKYSKIIYKSQYKALYALASLALISGGYLFYGNKTSASGVTQDRSYNVLEGELLKNVLKFEEAINLQSKEFPKGLQFKIKNVSEKPIYFVDLFVWVSETQPPPRFGKISFPLNHGHSKLSANSTKLEDLDPDDQEKARAAEVKPGDNVLLELSNREAEMFQKIIESSFGSESNYTKKVTVSVQVINFGDGTGYIIGKPYPKRPSPPQS